MSDKKHFEGKYNYFADFELYQGKNDPHCDRGLGEIRWNDAKGKLEIDIVTIFYSKSYPDKVLAAIAFNGYFDTEIPEIINDGDVINLNYLMRIGLDYASQGSKPEGNYSWSISKVKKHPNGNIDAINIQIDTGRTKGEMSLKKVVEI